MREWLHMFQNWVVAHSGDEVVEVEGSTLCGGDAVMKAESSL